MWAGIACFLPGGSGYFFLIVAAFCGSVEQCHGVSLNVITQCCAAADCRFFCTCVVRLSSFLEA